MPNVAILGASGYGGGELLRLLAQHPHFTPKVLCAESQAGVPVAALYPHLGAKAGRFLSVEEALPQIHECELVFSALPHGKSMPLLPRLESRVIVDLGGDFRLKNAALYTEWYGLAHAASAELSKWTYGLPELFREKLRGATRIANPGCYATAAILAAAPLVKAGVIEGPLVIDALSGTSGAGRQAKDTLHFSHVDENIEAYRVARHQHTPEIEAALADFGGRDARVSLTAHLAPMSRGIHATCSATLRGAHELKSLRELYEAQYGGEPFITLSTEPSGTKHVRGSNRAAISVHLDARVNRVIVTCALDNLVKGAAGQAIQNANLAFGFSETLALPVQALYP